MDRKKYLILAGGRPGIVISGKDVLQLTLERFAAVCPDIRVILVLPPEDIDSWRNYCAVRNFNLPQRLVTTGFTPFHSLRNALAEVPDGVLAIVHDADRPLVSTGLIAGMLRRMEEGARALIPVVPAEGDVKTVRREEGITGSFSPEEGEVLLAQTPQMFLSEDLKAAYAQPYSTDFTDAASVVAARIKIPLVPVRGERYNLKVCDPQDAAVARVVLREVIPAYKKRS